MTSRHKDVLDQKLKVFLTESQMVCLFVCCLAVLRCRVVMATAASGCAADVFTDFRDSDDDDDDDEALCFPPVPRLHAVLCRCGSGMNDSDSCSVVNVFY